MARGLMGSRDRPASVSTPYRTEPRSAETRRIEGAPSSLLRVRWNTTRLRLPGSFADSLLATKSFIASFYSPAQRLRKERSKLATIPGRLASVVAPSRGRAAQLLRLIVLLVFSAGLQVRDDLRLAAAGDPNARIVAGLDAEAAAAPIAETVVRSNICNAPPVAAILRSRRAEGFERIASIRSWLWLGHLSERSEHLRQLSIPHSHEVPRSRRTLAAHAAHSSAAVLACWASVAKRACGFEVTKATPWTAIRWQG
jgi:hypothetical protein